MMIHKEKKKREFKGEVVEKRRKRGNFSLYLGEKLSFWKVGGWGQKYHNLGKYTPLSPRQHTAPAVIKLPMSFSFNVFL